MTNRINLNRKIKYAIVYGILFLMLFSNVVSAAHTFDNSATVGTTQFPTSPNPRTVSYTAGNGATLMVVTIFVNTGSNTRDGGAPTYNGKTMTAAYNEIPGNSNYESYPEIWYLLLTPDDTGSAYTVSVPNTGSDRIQFQVATYKSATGVSALDGSPATDIQTSGSNPSASVTTTANGDVIVSALGDGYQYAPTAVNVGYILYANDAGPYSASTSYYLQPSAGTRTITWTLSSSSHVLVVAAFKEVNPLPTTVSISPNSKNVGDSGFTMTVTGTNFVSGSTVRIGGSNRVTTYGSSTSLTAAILTSDMTSAATLSINVFNPTPGGGTSNAQTFTVTPAPTYSLNTTYTFSETNSNSTWQSISIKDSSYGDVLANVSILNATSGRWESILTSAFTDGISPGEHVNVIKGASSNASSYDAGGGQIKIKYNWTNSASNNYLGVDLINVTVMYKSTYLLNITTNTLSVPVNYSNYYLEINYSHDANETGYDVYVYNGSVWNLKGSLTSSAWTQANFTLSSSEVINGNVSIRYLDQTPAGISQGNLYIDYQRIGYTSGISGSYRLNVTTNTSEIPQTANHILQLRYNVSGDNFTLQIWNGSSWNNRTTLNDISLSYRNITLLSNELIPDGVNKSYSLVRYLDLNASATQQGTIYLDYQRIYNV